MRQRTWFFITAVVVPGLLSTACSSDSSITEADGATNENGAGATSGSSATAGAGSGAGAAAGAAGSTSSNSKCSPTAASIQTTVFKASCDGAGCHGAVAPAAGLNLVGASPDLLSGKSSALCPGWSLIVPGSPEKSLLYQKLVSNPPVCGDAMPLNAPLPAGDAQCIADWIQSMAASNGCEKCGGSECVALASDAQHCGSCNNACPAGVLCDNGACTCPGGGQACNGSCVDVQTDAKNCGKCGNACASGQSCVAGKCSCPTGLNACSAACVDLSSDATHCGSCDQACAAKQVCSKGQCSSGCGSLTQCGTSCVDTQTSLLNCGACGTACAPGLACSAGKCACANGGKLCGATCTDTKTDAANCGGCGMKCGAGEACVAGACQCSSSTAVSFKNDVLPILTSDCTAAGCHSGMKPKENLSLEAAKAYGELVNVTATQCGGSRKLVAPGSPGTSYLMQKLLGVDVCTGTQMPKAGSSLPQKQLDLISGWICSGAANN